MLVPTPDSPANALNNGALTALLQHLQMKIQGFETERLTWLARFETLRLNLATKSTSVHQLRRLVGEQLDLGRAVSETRVQFLEERLQRQELEQENKEIEDRDRHGQKERVGELATVYKEEAVEQAVRFKKGQKPSKVTKFTGGGPQTGPTNTQASSMGLKHHTAGQSRVSSYLDQNKPIKAVYKTVVIPKEVIDLPEYGGYGERDESLTAHVALATFKTEEVLQKEAEIRALEDYAERLRDEIDKREIKNKSSLVDVKARLARTDNRSRNIEDTTRKLNEEYFSQRTQHDQQVRRLQEEKELLTLKSVSLRKQYEEAKLGKTLENHITKDLAEKRSKEYAQSFKHRSQRKEETLEIVREQYRKVKDIYGDKIGSLEEAVVMLRSETDRMRRQAEAKANKERGIAAAARKMLKGLIREVEVRGLGGEWREDDSQTGKGDQEETVNLDDLDRLNYKMRDIDQKLRED